MKSIDARLSRRDRSGFSIFELMIAIVISLIVLVVMMQAFKRASGEIKKGRSMIAMASEMRAVGETFRRDLANTTVSPRVWNLTSESNGYFEIVEGPQNDATYAAAPLIYPGMSFFGDVDDVVAMTIRSGEKPFRGRYDNDNNPATAPQIVESHVAEVVWFVVFENEDDADGNVDMDDHVTLYRRVLLIRPELPLYGAATDLDSFFLNNDISAHPIDPRLLPVGTPPGEKEIVANSLGDVTLRENRYAHVDSLPSPLPPPPLIAAPFPARLQPNLLLQRRLATGEDIMLTNVAGFDLRVYSPNAPVKSPNGEQLSGPNDPYYVFAVGDPIEGAYVDLGFTGLGWFSGLADPKSLLTQTWDSWSPHYEYNGIDDDDGGLGPIDEGSNGLDDGGLPGVVDDEQERETQPPYAYPIRAVQLTMRGIEKSTRNIRQVTITSSFVPE